MLFITDINRVLLICSNQSLQIDHYRSWVSNFERTDEFIFKSSTWRSRNTKIRDVLCIPNMH